MSQKAARKIRKQIKKMGMDWREQRKLYKKMKKRYYEKRRNLYGDKAA